MKKSIKEILEENSINLNVSESVLSLIFEGDFKFFKKEKKIFNVDILNENRITSPMKKEFYSYTFFSEDDVLVITPDNEENTVNYYEYIDEDCFDYISYDSEGRISEIS